MVGVLRRARPTGHGTRVALALPVKRLIFCSLVSMLLPGLARADPALAPSAWIHVEASGPVRLERIAPGEVEWRPVCDAPCDAVVRADGVFRVGGDDVRPSPSFVVRARPGQRVDIRVQRSSKTVHTLGVVGLAGGTAVASTALIAAFMQMLAAALQSFGTALGDTPCALSMRCTTPARPSGPNVTPALVTAAIGGVVTLAGATALLVDGQTRVDGPRIEGAPAPPTPPSEWIPQEESAPRDVAAGVGLRLRF
jgi:hypothetical protein